MELALPEELSSPILPLAFSPIHPISTKSPLKAAISLTHLGFPIRLHSIQAIGTGFSLSSLPHKPLNKIAAKSGNFVDPPGLEPGLCGTKIRRVANYTMGQ
jgi:hypothetical protein